MTSRSGADVATALGLAALSVLLGLLIGEVVIRWVAPQPPGVGWFTEDGVEVHVPGRSLVYRRHDYAARVRFNDLGFRGDAFAIPKPPGTRRVLALGDSFTEGLQVPDDRLFTTLLAEGLREGGRAADVLDLGVSGYGQARELDLLELYGRRLEPDLVVVFFCIDNDVSNNALDGRCRLVDGALACAPLEPLRGRRLLLSRIKSYLGTYSQVYQLVRAATSSPVFQRLGLRAAEVAPEEQATYESDMYLREAPAYLRDALDLTGALLARLREEAGALGAPTRLVLLPSREQVEDARWDALARRLGPERVQRDEPQRAVREQGERAGLPVIDLYPAFLARAARGEKLYWNVDGHFNEAGHEETARVVLGVLRETDPFPPGAR